MSRLQIAIALDQAVNAFLGGYADETFSARCWRKGKDGGAWGFARVIVDAVFFWEPDHCKTAYQSEMARRQLPPEYRNQNIVV